MPQDNLPNKSDEMPKLPEEILEQLGGEADPERVQEVIEAAMYSGPLPPPSMLRNYNEALPGLADRIVSMVEKEQSIRGRDNFFVLLNDSFRIFGSILVSLGLVGGAVYCAIIGQVELGIALAASGAVPQIVRYFRRK